MEPRGCWNCKHSILVDGDGNEISKALTYWPGTTYFANCKHPTANKYYKITARMTEENPKYPVCDGWEK